MLVCAAVLACAAALAAQGAADRGRLAVERGSVVYCASNGLRLVLYCLWGNREPGNEMQTWFLEK